jgi:hypothetical protein
MTTLTAAPSTAPTAADLDAARLLLTRLGISPADLLTASEQRAPVPTFVDYIPVVRAAVSSGTSRVYGTYWNRIAELWGTRRLDEPTPSEINQLAEHIKTHIVARRNARGGRGGTLHRRPALPVPARQERRPHPGRRQPGLDAPIGWCHGGYRPASLMAPRCRSCHTVAASSAGPQA